MTTIVVDAPLARVSARHVIVHGLSVSDRGHHLLPEASFEFFGSGIHVVNTPSTRASAALAHAIAGTRPVSSGRIQIDGRALDFGDRRAMLGAGVAVLGADVGLLPARSVAANIFLGREHAVHEEMEVDAAAILESLGADIHPLTAVSGVDRVDRLIVELARAIAAEAELVVAAEPGPALTRALVRAAERGTRVLLITCTSTAIDSLEIRGLD